VALPPGITPKTVTIGVASFFDGTLAEGTATITAPVNVVHTPTNRPIFSSSISQRFVDGVASFNLAPTDAPGLNRVDWTYSLRVVISGALVQPDPIWFTLPTAGPDTVDLDSLVTVPSSAGVPISATVVTSVNGQVGDVTVAAGSSTTDASLLTSGTLPAARIADGSITAAKVAADVATQAELDAASTADRVRANHTGTQLAATISDFGAAVAADATVKGLTDTVAATPTPQPTIVRGHSFIFKPAADAWNFPNIIAWQDPARKRLIIRNRHATASCKVAYSADTTLTYNPPSDATFTTVLAPGQEYVEAGGERYLFVKPTVNGDSVLVSVYYEGGVL
jgi:hypothetical protein